MSCMAPLHVSNLRGSLFIAWYKSSARRCKRSRCQSGTLKALEFLVYRHVLSQASLRHVRPNLDL